MQVHSSEAFIYMKNTCTYVPTLLIEQASLDPGSSLGLEPCELVLPVCFYSESF